jgi:nucleoid-associated protein YgaU
MEKTIKVALKWIKWNENKLSAWLGGLVVVVLVIMGGRFFLEKYSISNIEYQGKEIGEILEKREEVKEDLVVVEKYVVKQGDGLWQIAVKVYGDGYQWTKILEANKDKIGGNAEELEVGVELVIPR